MITFIFSNNTKYSFENLEAWISAHKSIIFYEKQFWELDFEHQFSGDSWDYTDMNRVSAPKWLDINLTYAKV